MTFPNSWIWTKLEECVDTLDSHRIPVNRTEREKRTAGKEKYTLYPYFGATGLVDWIDDYIFDEEIVLLGEDGAPFLEPSKDKAYIVRGKCWVNNHAHVLRARYGVTTNPYIMHYLNFIDYHEYVTGTTRLKLNQSRMRDIPVLLPPLPEQERIVARIESLFTRLDAGVAGLKRAQAALKRYKASVLKAACEGRLVPQDPNDEPADVLLQRILAENPARGGSRPAPVTDDLPALPLGWCWAKLSVITKWVVDVDHRMPKPAVTDIPYISTRDFINYDEIDYDNAKKISESDYRILCRKVKPEYNDILLSRYGTVGEVRQVKTNRNFQASYSIAIIKTLTEINISDYLSIALRCDIVKKQINRDIRATAQPDLGLAHIRNFDIPLPPLEEQHRIVAEVERRLSLVQELEAAISLSLQRASRLRQAILIRAFEGRLVEQNPGDAPADGLLERLKTEYGNI